MNADSPLRSFILNRPFETQIVLIISLLAVGRISIALAIDAVGSVPRGEVLTDLSLFILFTGLLYYASKREIKRVHPIFGIILTLLLAINFLEFGGIFGMSRFNYLLGMFGVLLLYRGKALFVLVAFQSVLLVVITASSYLSLDWTQLFFLHSSVNYSDFIFALLVFASLTYYLKLITLVEFDRYATYTNNLHSAVGTLTASNKMLGEKTAELKVTQRDLERQLEKRVDSLRQRNRAIETYIHINSKVLQGPVAELNTLLNNLNQEINYADRLKFASNELQEVFVRIKSTLDAREELDREKLDL